MPKSPRPDPHICSINDHAFRHGISMARVIERSGVARSTWKRLREGHRPSLETLANLRAALDALIAEDEADGELS